MPNLSQPTPQVHAVCIICGRAMARAVDPMDNSLYGPFECPATPDQHRIAILEKALKGELASLRETLEVAQTRLATIREDLTAVTEERDKLKAAIPRRPSITPSALPQRLPTGICTSDVEHQTCGPGSNLPTALKEISNEPSQDMPRMLRADA